MTRLPVSGCGLPCAAPHLVFKNHESILHVFANGRDQLQSLCEELLKERLGEIVAIADQLTPQRFGHRFLPPSSGSESLCSPFHRMLGRSTR